MAKQVDITYGNALFEFALEEGRLDDLYEEAQVLVDILRDNEELIRLLNHPHIDKEEKKKIIETAFGGRVSDELTGLMVMLAEKNHSAKLVDVFSYFIRQVKKAKNIGVAGVTSAVVLSDSQKKAIEQRLIETTAYDSMEVDYNVDGSIIGGLVIRIEDRVVDSSIKTQLETLSKSLINA
jgi:F-type H+-transporting ATPase subunit delta